MCSQLWMYVSFCAGRSKGIVGIPLKCISLKRDKSFMHMLQEFIILLDYGMHSML